MKLEFCQLTVVSTKMTKTIIEITYIKVQKNEENHKNIHLLLVN